MQQIPVLRSDQEQLIENYINSSFGSYFLYAPLNYKYSDNGKIKDGEPCDLFWSCGNMAVLFSMTTSKRDSLEKQKKHNVEQLQEYLDRWRTNREEFELCGENRFGKTCRVKYKEIDSFILVSLVGKKCGVKTIKVDPHKKEIWLNAPDEILKILSRFNGSLVDFLHLTLTPKNAGEIETFDGLCNVAKKYIHEGENNNGNETLSILEGYESDLAALQKYLEYPKGEEVGKGMTFLYDLSLRQRTDLLHKILNSIHKAKPPKFDNSGIFFIKLHYWFIISVVNFSAKSSTLIVKKSLEEAKKIELIGDSCVNLIYGKIFDDEDFRIPKMTMHSDFLNVLQAKTIFDLYIDWKEKSVIF